jgi:hypothetical protein
MCEPDLVKDMSLLSAAEVRGGEKRRQGKKGWK